MKNRNIAWAVVPLLVIALTGGIRTLQGWTITENHSIRIDNFDITGRFEKFSGDIVFDAGNLAASRFNVRVAVQSLSTGNILKTKSALSSDWFGVGKFPYITFVSSRIEKDGKGWKATGDLTIRDVKKTVVIPFTFEEQGNDGVFSGEFTVDRVDFGVGSELSEVAYDVKVILAVPVRKIRF